MITGIRSDRILTPEGILDGYVYIEGDTITAVTDARLPCQRMVDLTGLYVSPGFIDLHTHGGDGFDFLCGEDAVLGGSDFHLRHGTTSICPTISAVSFGDMQKAVAGVAAAMKNPRRKANIPGAHMEGPYLSRSQCGAQSTDFITLPDPAEYEPLIRQYGHAIARWTYAPENDRNGEFAAFLTANHILPSAGHTGAIYGEMQTAMAAGCRLVTHLYSCTSTVTRAQGFRRLGVIETAFLQDELYVEIIADGKHLPPELIRMILKIKGTDRVALVTDSLAIAGTDARCGRMVDTEFIIEDGVCKLADRSAFAGSIATADMLIRTVTQKAGVSLCDAVKMLTRVPAELLGLNKGALTPGKDADIIAFDDDIGIHSVFVMGKEVLGGTKNDFV